MWEGVPEWMQGMGRGENYLIRGKMINKVVGGWGERRGNVKKGKEKDIKGNGERGWWELCPHR